MGCGSSTPAQVPTVRPAAGSTTATERTPPPAPSGSAAASHPRPAQPEAEPTTRGGETESKSPEPAFTPASAEQNGQAGASDGATSGAATDAAKESTEGGEPPEAPVRLLLVGPFAGFEEAVPCYENLPAGSFIDVDIADYHARYAADTAVISWRWMRPKPPSAEAAADPLANPVPSALVEYVSHLSERDSMKYLWLDWSCAPQYPKDLAATMREINRSGTYYATARGFYIWCFAARVTVDSFEHSDYFYRAWTLSERLHRAATKGALTPADFLPTFESTVFSSTLRPVKEWGPPMAQLAGRASIALMMGRGQLGEGELLELTGMVVNRYPLLGQLALRLDGPFHTLLPPDVAAGMRVALGLRAVAEWIAAPDDDLDDMTGAFQMRPLQFKQFLLHGLLNHARMTLNNLSGGLNSSLESVATAATEVKGAATVSGLLGPVEAMWQAAMGTPTSESGASPAWLRRYLVFEAGRSYKAFSSIDLLFAIYKLFDLGDFSYGQEDALYAALLRKAGAAFMSDLQSHPYGWLQELAVMSNKQEDVLSAVLTTAKNSRAEPAYVPSPANFGLLFLHSAAPTVLDPGAQLPVPALLGPEPMENVLSHVLGFRLDCAAQWALARLAQSGELPRVPKETGGEMDSRLSLRGRKALGLFEDRLHAALAEQMVEPWEQDCGLFLVVRYGTMACLSRVLLLRTSPSGDGGWTVEYVSAFGSDPQKGSSWGIAQALEGLVAAVAGLPGTTSSAYATYGDCSALAQSCPLDAGLFDGDTEWFSGHTLSFVAGPEPTPSDEAPPASKSGSGADDDGSRRTERPLEIPEGETMFEDSEIELAESAYEHAASAEFNADSLAAYHRMLSRNCVASAMMAKHLGFYGSLCTTLAMHLLVHGEEFLQAEMLKTKFEQLLKGLDDALRDAGEGAESADEAREAMASLQDALRSAMEFIHDSGGGKGGDSDYGSDDYGGPEGKSMFEMPFVVPPGKTAFDDEELDLVDRAYLRMSDAAFSADTMTDYYNLLVRNYVHDSVMAAHLGYFARLCIKYADHLAMSGEVLLAQSVLKRKLGELVEDMGDAIGDSDDEANKEAARKALASLEEAIEASS
eukprot:jgi/Tetstr1/443209/TSEL_031249.t1